jgi:hypothetical protein
MHRLISDATRTNCGTIEMRLAFWLSASVVGLLMVSVFSSAICFSAQATLGSRAAASQTQIDTNAEYTNGSIPRQTADIWYAWVNVSKTQVIYYALFSDEVNSPVINFLGQHFQVENDTEVFVGNTLTLIEVYNDTNGDGIPQANFTSGESEIAYYLLVNSSIGYEITPIQKILEGEVPHYTWGFKYETIDGFLLSPEQQPGQGAATVIIDHLGFNYDFYISGNVSYIKKSFDIGRITEIQPILPKSSVSLDGLSLSLLFSTITISAKPYTAYVNGQPYNSTTAENPATAIVSGEIAVETIKAYEFLFGENYNLTRGESVETHEAKSEAAATTSVPQGAQSRLKLMLYHLENNLNISDLFPSCGIGGRVNLDCNVSTLVYRVCYPVWDGLPIQHDPTYIAYLFSNIIIPEFPLPMMIPILVITASLAMLTAKTRKRRP